MFQFLLAQILATLVVIAGVLYGIIAVEPPHFVENFCMFIIMLIILSLPVLFLTLIWSVRL